jgi:MiaB-like tRNA modifying enzyme
MKVFVKHFGCAFSRAEAEIIKGLLSEKHEIVEGEDEADVVVVVTCHVKESTFKKVLNYIESVKSNVVVYGCLPTAYEEFIKRKCPMLDVCSITNVLFAVEHGKSFKSTKKVVKLGFKRVRYNQVVGIVPICEGCTGNCSYCAVKLARNGLFSYPEEAVVREVERFVREGCVEIWLTAQDVGAYGMDRNTSICSLLKKVGAIKSFFKVRVGMMNPAHVKKYLQEYLDVIEGSKFYKFFHLPVQSGSDKILELMRRRYTSREFEEMCKEIRKRFPLAQIWTDIIVGFPYETEEDFEMSVKLVEKVEPDWVNVSKFSPMPKTEAFKMKEGFVDTREKKRRSSVLMEVVREVAERVNERWIKWCGEAVVVEKGKRGYIARNFAYKPIVVEGDFKLGDVIEVEVEGASNVLFGRKA